MSFFKLSILLNFFMSFCRTRRLAFIGFALINLLFQCAIVHSQDIYPNKPIRLIVGFPPGGGNDLLSRLVAAKLSEVKGWAFSIENVAGSGGLLGANNIAKSTPNGYTIGIGSIGTLSINPSLYSKIPYNIAKDFTFISRLSITPAALVVPANSPFRSVQELISSAKSNPGKLNFGSAGNGTSHHLIGELFKFRVGIEMTHVPYAGSSPAVVGLMRSDVQLMFADLPAVLPMIRAGKLRALAVTTKQTSSLLPEALSMDDVLPGFDVSIWYGIVGPAGLSPEITKTLNQAIKDVVALPEIQNKLSHEGAFGQTSSPEDFAAFVKTEVARWADVIQQAKVPLQ
jgi:tripartite-type tricarboxylate transporter receptor subunit TctC